MSDARARAKVQLEVLGLGQETGGKHLSDARVETAIVEAIEQEREGNPEWPLAPTPEEAKDVAADLVAKALKLMNIVRKSLQSGIHVRFFSTDAVGARPPWITAGNPGMVTIINAIEVFFVPSVQFDPGMNLYLAMSLTAQNRRALAPFLWDAGCREAFGEMSPMYSDDRLVGQLCASSKPWGVLIWSDGAGESARVTGSSGVKSDFVPWEHVALMTAPHHASGTADHRMIWAARDAFCKSTGRDIPVLSAGGTQKDTATEFTNELPSNLRACTRCRHLKERSSKTIVSVVDGAKAHLTPTCAR